MTTLPKSARLFIVVLLVLGMAQFMPRIVNTLLLLIMASMVVINANQFAQIINLLNFK